MQYFLVVHVHLLGSMLSSAAVDTIRYGRRLSGSTLDHLSRNLLLIPQMS